MTAGPGDQRARPQVRLAGAGPGPTAEPAPTGPPGRTGRLLAVSAGLAVVVVVLLARPWSSPTDDRVDLRVDPVQATGPEVTSTSKQGGPVVVHVPVGVRNAGPLPVRVTSAVLVGSPLRSVEAVTVPAGGAATLSLTQDVTCPTGRAPALVAAGTPLRLSAAARSRVVTELRLTPPAAVVDAYRHEVLRLCGYLPVEESVQRAGFPGQLDGATLEVPLTLINTSALPARLLSVTPGPAGLALEVRSPGGLPLDLPAATGPWPLRGVGVAPATAVELDLTLEPDGCAQLAAHPTSSAATPRVLVELAVDHGPGTPTTLVDTVDAGLAVSLLQATCAAQGPHGVNSG